MSCENFIVKSFEGQEIDFIEREKEIWITARAIAKGLDIDRTTVIRIFNRNKTLLEPYTGMVKMTTPQGTQQNTRVFDRVGFIGICMRSNSPKALPFQQWTLKIIEEIERKGYYIAKDKDIIDIIKNIIFEQKKLQLQLNLQLNNTREIKYNSILKKLDSFSWITTKELSKTLEGKKGLFLFENLIIEIE